MLAAVTSCALQGLDGVVVESGSIPPAACPA
jgi:hypothetical protein